MAQQQTSGPGRALAEVAEAFSGSGPPPSWSTFGTIINAFGQEIQSGLSSPFGSQSLSFGSNQFLMGAAGPGGTRLPGGGPASVRGGTRFATTPGAQAAIDRAAGLGPVAGAPLVATPAPFGPNAGANVGLPIGQGTLGGGGRPGTMALFQGSQPPIIYIPRPPRPGGPPGYPVPLDPASMTRAGILIRAALRAGAANDTSQWPGGLQPGADPRSVNMLRIDQRLLTQSEIRRLLELRATFNEVGGLIPDPPLFSELSPNIRAFTKIVRQMSRANDIAEANGVEALGPELRAFLTPQSPLPRDLLPADFIGPRLPPPTPYYPLNVPRVPPPNPGPVPFGPVDPGMNYLEWDWDDPNEMDVADVPVYATSSNSGSGGGKAPA